MSKSLLSNVSFLLLINLLIKPLFIFGIDIPVQNKVGAEAYGFYFALFNFAFIFNVVLDFGINNFTQRLIARNPDRVTSWLPNMVFVKLLLALVFLLVVFLFAVGFQFEEKQLQLLLWICLNRILISFHMFFRANVAGLQAFRHDAVLSISDRLLTIILVGALLYTDVLDGEFTIYHFVFGTAIALALSASLSWLVLRLKTGAIGLSWNRRLFKTILLRSYPFALLGVLMTLYNRIDGVMLERMLGDEGDFQAGVYAAAYRLLDAATMFAFLISGILLPLFARMIKKKRAVWPVLQVSSRLMSAISISGALTGAFFAHPIMDVLYVEADLYWSSIFGLLIVGFVFNASVYVFGSLLTADGKLTGLNIIALSGVLLNIILNLILIPEHKAYGAAMATIGTQALVAFAHVIYTARLFSWGSKLIAELPGLLLFTGLLSATGYLLVSFSPLNWAVNLLIMALSSGILAMATRQIDISRLRTELTQ